MGRLVARIGEAQCIGAVADPDRVGGGANKSIVIDELRLQSAGGASETGDLDFLEVGLGRQIHQELTVERVGSERERQRVEACLSGPRAAADQAYRIGESERGLGDR